MKLDEFVSKYQKVPVVEYPNNVLSKVPKPIVSCRVSTYQHAPYIRQCLDGILMQKTVFPFEIVIGEDESTDGTREICIEYANKYPDLIRLFLHKRANNILVDGKPTAKFQGNYTIYHLRGKYHALCEGDDYWIDPYKLQKQVDFLNENPDYGAVFTKAKILLEPGNILKKRFINSNANVPSGFVLKELVHGNPFITCTSLFHSKFVDELFPDSVWIYSDRVLWIDIASKAKIGFMNEFTATYRVLGSSASHYISLEKQIRAIKQDYRISLYYSALHNIPLNKDSCKLIYRKVVIDFLLKNWSFCNFKILFTTQNPIEVLKRITNIFLIKFGLR